MPPSARPTTRRFPRRPFTVAARVYPSLVPATPQDPASEANRRAWEVFRSLGEALRLLLQRRRSDHARDGDHCSSIVCPAREGSATRDTARRPLHAGGRSADVRSTCGRCDPVTHGLHRFSALKERFCAREDCRDRPSRSYRHFTRRHTPVSQLRGIRLNLVGASLGGSSHVIKL